MDIESKINQLAHEALEQADGEHVKACELLAARINSEPRYKQALLEPFFAIAIREQIAKAAQQKRNETRRGGGQTLIGTHRSGAPALPRVSTDALRQAHATALGEWHLCQIHGRRLYKFTAADCQRYSSTDAATSRAYAKRAEFLRLLADELQKRGAKTVREIPNAKIANLAAISGFAKESRDVA